MNSTPIYPNDLINEGAYVGNIIDFINDSEYNEMLLVIEKIKDYSITNRNTDLYCRYMFNGEKENYNYKHKILLNEVEERDIYVQKNNLTIFQKWYEYTINQKPNEIKYHSIFDKTGKKILDHFYPNYEINYNSSGTFTLYEDGHFIDYHTDGNNPGRVCVIIIYLSSELEYNSNGGGELVITTNSQKKHIIKPILGTFSLLDFTKNNIYHQVNMVKNGFKRYAFINFFNVKDRYIG